MRTSPATFLREVRAEMEKGANASLVASVKDARSALSQSTRLYNAGLSDFLTVLTDERTLFASRDALAESDLALVDDDIALFKALGGGWQHIVLDPPGGSARVPESAAR